MKKPKIILRLELYSKKDDSIQTFDIVKNLLPNPDYSLKNRGSW